MSGRGESFGDVRDGVTPVDALLPKAVWRAVANVLLLETFETVRGALHLTQFII